MRTTQLNHVGLQVENVERSCQFYSQVLRLEQLERPAFPFPGAWFRLGADQELHLIGGRDRPVVSQHRGDHFALMVDDMDAWERHLASAGIGYRPRQTRPDGAQQIFLADPDGHVIELCTPPPRGSE